MKEFILRAVTAVAMVGVCCLLLFLLPSIFLWLGLWVVVLLASWEWARLVGLDPVNRLMLLGVMSVLLLPVIIYSYFGWGCLMLGVIFWCCIFFMMWHGTLMRYLPHVQNYIGIMLACGYLLPASAAIVILYKENPFKLLYILGIVWVADIAAYVVGSFFGATLLAPTISPKKSWQGVGGAVCFVWIYMFFINYMTSWGSSYWKIIPLGVLWVSISIGGDLFESMLKRAKNMKDSGIWLPGHGGLLDRVDSLLAMLPFVMVLQGLGMV